MAHRFVRGEHMAALQKRRLENLENRLALLDGGPDADIASRSALSELNAAQAKEGKAPLLFRFVDGTGNRIEWFGGLKDKQSK